MRKITIKNFQGIIEGAIRAGEGALDDAIDAYLWARIHIKEVHKAYPKYRQSDSADAIRRVFNVEPDTYLRTACRLGGGDDQEACDAGRSIIKRVGAFEAFRADNMLGVEQMGKLGASISSRCTQKQFRKKVDTLYKKEVEPAKGISEKKESRSPRLDYRAEYLKLVKKVAGLEARLEEKDELVKSLNSDVRWLKRQLASRPKGKAGKAG